MYRAIAAAMILTFALPAAAYIGPGAGISVLGSIVSIVLGIILALAAIVLWPLRRMLKRKKNQSASPETDA
ncbi:MAG: FeoB-associated Cys-rich membrane protein [Xanthomonadales bacterium]|nr:FeoB-associated Cys-rich membrane protein [Xanthomonadales bacterium]